jgi:hypothetical protein
MFLQLTLIRHLRRESLSDRILIGDNRCAPPPSA